MLGDSCLSQTRTGQRDHVGRWRMLQPSTDSSYPPMTQVIEVGEQIALVSFHPSLGRQVPEPAEKALQVAWPGQLQRVRCYCASARSCCWLRPPPRPRPSG